MSQAKRHLALIDDDPLVQATWKIMSTYANETLSSSHTLDEFLIQDVPKDTPVYVDHHLGQENGTLIAAKLLELGYKFVYICTGLNPQHLQAPAGLCGIVGKEYPTNLPESPCHT